MRGALIGLLALHCRLAGGTAPDPNCATGIKFESDVCCAASCGQCDGVSGCSGRPGGANQCCAGKIRLNNFSCSTTGPGCVIAPPDPECATGLRNKEVCCHADCTECYTGSNCGFSNLCCESNIRLNGASCNESEPPCIMNISLPSTAAPQSGPDPTCATGIVFEDVCCRASCTRCDGVSGCSNRDGGSNHCCAGKIRDNDLSCSTAAPGCVIRSPAPTSAPSLSPSVSECNVWGCTCQGFSDHFGTRPGAWGCASDTEARNWWRRMGCSTSASGPMDFLGCPDRCAPWGCTCQGLSDYYRTQPGQWRCASGAAQIWWRAVQCATTPSVGVGGGGCYDCDAWGCSCQTFSDMWGTKRGTWACAPPGAPRSWWRAMSCSTAPSDAEVLEGCPSAVCSPWGCSCQGFSDHFGTQSGDWHCADDAVPQDWWGMVRCSSTPSGGPPYPACPAPTVSPSAEPSMLPPDSLSPSVCTPWGCTCQGFSDYFGTRTGHWACATTSEARYWWMLEGCSTSASGPMDFPGCTESCAPYGCTCQGLSDYYRTSPGTWNCAPSAAQHWWKALQCATTPIENQGGRGCYDCDAWGCSCQNLSDKYAVKRGNWACTPPGTPRNWWIKVRCDTNASDPEVLEGCTTPDCSAWGCSCQGFSDYYGTQRGDWGCAEDADPQDWWSRVQCTSTPSGGPPYPACPAPTKQPTTEPTASLPTRSPSGTTASPGGTPNPTASPGCPVELAIDYNSGPPFQCRCDIIDGSTVPFHDRTHSYCGTMPSEWYGAVHFTCPHCFQSGAQFNISCPNNWAACDIYLLVYHCPGCNSAAYNGGWVQNLDAEWRPRHCAPNFCEGGDQSLSHSMNSYNRQVTAGTDVPLPATTTDKSYYFSMVVKPISSVCASHTDMTSCNAANGGTGCAWDGTAAACSNAFCPPSLSGGTTTGGTSTGGSTTGGTGGSACGSPCPPEDCVDAPPTPLR